ncbi:unnamed protein product, partial [Prorocentrum cordatum]
PSMPREHAAEPRSGSGAAPGAPGLAAAAAAHARRHVGGAAAAPSPAAAPPPRTRELHEEERGAAAFEQERPAAPGLLPSAPSADGPEAPGRRSGELEQSDGGGRRRRAARQVAISAPGLTAPPLRDLQTRGGISGSSALRPGPDGRLRERRAEWFEALRLVYGRGQER